MHGLEKRSKRSQKKDGAVVLEVKHSIVQNGCHDVTTGAQKECYKRTSSLPDLS
jgi:hypothetical protein